LQWLLHFTWILKLSLPSVGATQRECVGGGGTGPHPTPKVLRARRRWERGYSRKDARVRPEQQMDQSPLGGGESRDQALECMPFGTDWRRL